MNQVVIESLRTIFNTPNARSWQRSNRRPEIVGAHVPLSWLPLSWGAELRWLVDAGEVEIVALPSRVAGATSTHFVVKK